MEAFPFSGAGRPGRHVWNDGDRRGSGRRQRRRFGARGFRHGAREDRRGTGGRPLDAEPEPRPLDLEAGDSVEKGKTLCIIEAMKLMNEIEADISGTVVAIYPQNAQPVEFGEKLFAIQPR